jgi:hypothetical protein
MLVADPLPGRRAEAYAAWQARGGIVDIETDFHRAFSRMRHTSYTLVLMPVAAAGFRPAPEGFVGEFVAEWVADYAPNYAGRVIYYGAEDVVRAVVPRSRRHDPEHPVLILPPSPSATELTRATAMLEQVLADIAARRKATKQRRPPRE